MDDFGSISRVLRRLALVVAAVFVAFMAGTTIGSARAAEEKLHEFFRLPLYRFPIQYAGRRASGHTRQIHRGKPR